MTREFQVLYRLTENPGMATERPIGEVLTVLAYSEADPKGGALELEQQFMDSGLYVVAINFVRAIVDWSLPNFDREEAAEYLRINAKTLSMNKGDGGIPWSKIGLGIYPRAWLERMIEDHANPAGKTVAKRLAAAA